MVTFGWLLIIAIPPACYVVGHYRGRCLGRQEVHHALGVVLRQTKENAR